MADCTRTFDRCRRVIAVALLVCACMCATARADGDPASDVLASQSLFLPQDAGVAPAQQSQLTALLVAAHRSGYPIRVALIASRADLGSVTALWQRPQSYAMFLGQELSFLYRGPLLVAMPNGFGLYGSSGRETELATRLQAPGMATGLGVATLAAVRRLAAAAGHQLPLPAATAPAGTRDWGDTIAWIVFAAGCVAIVAAWAVSLRLRPPRLRRETTE
jgi:hypothetical protein